MFENYIIIIIIIIIKYLRTNVHVHNHILHTNIIRYINKKSLLSAP